MLFLLLSIIFAFFALILFVVWINGFFAKKIDEKNLEVLSIIEKLQYNSPINFAIKIIESNDFKFREIDDWLKNYLDLFGNNFQKITSEYIYINSKFKFSFITSIFLCQLHKKIKKLHKKIINLNNEIKEKISIKELEDNYKVMLVKKKQKLENKLKDFIILYPSFEKNELLFNLKNKINSNLELVDEKIDNGQFCLSANILFKIYKLINHLFNVLNLFPQILDLFNREIHKKINDILQIRIYSSNELKYEEFQKELSDFEIQINKNIEKLFDNLNNLKYVESLQCVNQINEFLTKYLWELELAKNLKVNYLDNDTMPIKNINFLCKNLEDLIMHSKLYLGEIDLLKDSERLLLKKARNIFYDWNIKINEFMKVRDKTISLKDFAFTIQQLKHLITISSRNSEYITEINKIYNNHKINLNMINEEIFRLKSVLNNLLHWINKYSNAKVKNNFYKKIENYFRQLERIKLKDIYPSNKIKINQINDDLEIIQKQIQALENDIKEYILFDKITEELIKHNNRYLMNYPELSKSIKDSKRAYNDNDIDLSFRISLSILNNIKEENIE